MRETTSGQPPAFAQPATQPERQPGERFARHIVLPMVVALVVLLAAIAVAIWQLEQREQARDADRAAQQVALLLHAGETRAIALLKTTSAALINDGPLTDALRRRDATRMVERARQLFELLQTGRSVTHLSVDLPDQTALVRMRADGPGTDPIDVERGQMGIDTLRVASTWQQGGQLLGRLELAVDFDSVVQDTHNDVESRVDFIVAVDKTLLDRQHWGDAAARNGRIDEWDRFPRVVVLSQTVAAIPTLAADVLSAGNPPAQPTRDGQHQVVFRPLTSDAGSSIGELIVIEDVAAELVDVVRTIQVVAGLSLGVGAMFIGFFYVLLTRIERDLARRTATLQDEVAARARAEEALRGRERVLSEAQRVAHVGSWDRVLETGTIIWSEELYRIYGVDPTLPVPAFTELAKFYTPESWSQLRAAVDQTLRSGAPFALDVEIVRTDDRHVWATTRCEALRDAAGHIVGTHGTVIDITDRKRADDEQSQLQAQLRQAHKMEAVGRLAGGVAHDFNNMLGVIIGRAELATERLDPAQPAWADLEEIRNAAVRSAALTRQLLAFARKEHVSPRVLDLNDTVAGLLKMLRRLIGENVELHWRPGANLWNVKVDPSQIDQILANLCVNGRDAIAGVGTMTIESANSTLDEDFCATHPGCIPGQYVRLDVSDTGCGMDADTQSKIFEPFFTTKGVGEGTGLGLASVFGAVRQNDGFIYVDSRPGRGSTFTIYLPRSSGPPVPIHTSRTRGQQVGGHETILLVEDEAAVLSLSKRILERQGYTVLAASGPDDAFRLAKQHDGNIRLLITDVILPGMNGSALAKSLVAAHPGLKCLFVSGYPANVISCLGGLDDGIPFMHKPYSTEALAAKVRDVLDDRN